MPASKKSSQTICLISCRNIIWKAPFFPAGGICIRQESSKLDSEANSFTLLNKYWPLILLVYQSFVTGCLDHLLWQVPLSCRYANSWRSPGFHFHVSMVQSWKKVTCWWRTYQGMILMWIVVCCNWLGAAKATGTRFCCWPLILCDHKFVFSFFLFFLFFLFNGVFLWWKVR